MFQTLIDQLNTLAHQYLPLIKTVEGLFVICGTVVTFVFGPRLYRYWFKPMIDERDQAKEGQSNSDRQLAELNLELVDTRRHVEELETKLNRVRDAFNSEDKDLWLREPIYTPTTYHTALASGNSIPIILVANLKGGVGKTTLAANLAAYFEMEHSERVLAIDLDYQGSLSSMLFPEQISRKDRSAVQAINLISGQASGESALANTHQIGETEWDSRFVECFYPFANFETKLTLKWLIEDIKEDIRYNLFYVLQSKIIQDQFDRIIIDAPPRVTTGFINALCASTHLLIPTVLDGLSAEAVGSFLKDINRMRSRLFPKLRIAGIAGTMKRQRGEAKDKSVRKAMDQLASIIQKEIGTEAGLFEDAIVTRAESIADAAGLRVAYRYSQDPQNIFKPLGDRIYSRIENQPTVASELRPLP